MLVEKLPQNDIDLITTYREWFAANDDVNGSAAATEYILRLWDTSKQNYLWEMFGEQFILQKNIEFTKDSEMMETELNDNLYNSDSRGYAFLREFREKLCKYTDNPCYPWECADPDWHMSDEEKQVNDIPYYCKRLIDYDSLGDNIYCGEDFIIPFPDGTQYKVNNGCKTSRVLGKIATAFKINYYEDFRLAHSLALNQKAAKGTLCLSIHPLDYMTMSDNDSGWDSCMSWMNEGSYRMGTVEMMNSPCVIVAYLKSDTDMRISNSSLYWNNKKWRELFVVRAGCLVNIMGYPYHSKELEVIVLKWLKELAEKNLGWSNWVGNSNGDPVEFEANDTFTPDGMDHPMRLHAETDRMYNDFRSTHRIYVNKDLNSESSIRFDYSGPAECMWCGSSEASFDEDSDLCCYACLDSTRCDCCGSRWDSDQLCQIDGMWVCPDCFDNSCITCDGCDETHHEDYLREVFIIPRIAGDNPEFGIRFSLCDNCFDELINNGIAEGVQLKTSKDNYWRSRDYLYSDELLDNGAKIIGYENQYDLKISVAKIYEQNAPLREVSV